MNRKIFINKFSDNVFNPSKIILKSQSFNSFNEHKQEELLRNTIIGPQGQM